MAAFFFYNLIIFAFAIVNAYDIPCIYGEYDYPPGCEERIFPCQNVSDEGVAFKILKDENKACSDINVDEHRVSHTMQKGEDIANLYYVEFDAGRDGECYAIRMYAGESWGQHPVTGQDYGCQGRCGASCESSRWKCSNWSRDCLKHDVCSYFFGSSDGVNDVDCGDEFLQAANDWTRCCAIWCSDRKCVGPGSSSSYFP